MPRPGESFTHYWVAVTFAANGHVPYRVKLKGDEHTFEFAVEKAVDFYFAQFAIPRSEPPAVELVELLAYTLVERKK